jgi:hypothetical protein
MSRPSLFRTSGWSGLLVAVTVLCGAGPATAAGDDTVTDGPVVSLDRDTVEPGERVVVTLDGFAAPSVTIEVCGNEARRGSSDCNMAASEGLRIDAGDEPTVVQMPIAAPPVDCPCVLRVSSRATGELAIVPVALTGHPVGPVVEGPSLEGLVDITITAAEAPAGLVATVRAALGGPAPYAVTVSVRNRSVETLRAARVSALAQRSATDTVAVIDFDQPGPILPGQTWRQTVTVTVPSPSFGTVTWNASVAGAGPTVKATQATHHQPVLLVVLLMVLVVLVAAVVLRRLVRRRAQRGAEVLAAA